MSKTELHAYDWSTAENPIALRLRRTAVSQIGARGEQSGVLLGHKGILNGKPAVVVESAGPLGRPGIDAIVGLYRYAGSTGELTAEDGELLARYVPGSTGVFLLIGTDSATATLFLYYQGRVTRVGDAPLTELSMKNAKRPASPRLRRTWLAVGAGSLLLLGTAAIAWRMTSQPQAAPLPVATKPAPATARGDATVQSSPTLKPSPLVKTGSDETRAANPIPLVNPQLPPPAAAQTPASKSKGRAVVTAPLRFTKWLFRRHKSS